MRILVGTAVIELVKGDITLQEVNAIGNADNRVLRRGGGVDGAIHEASVPTILAELKRKVRSECELTKGWRVNEPGWMAAGGEGGLACFG